MEAGGRIIVRIDEMKCIACSACQHACHHGSRYYEDDTLRFFSDLRGGAQISLFMAPAMRTNFRDWGRMLTWLRNCGVDKIYDVSLGADICTWAHIRYIQKNNPPPIISQPCPAIVNYVLMYKNELLKHLSPVHSPMLCTAVYMRRYEGVTSKIAALSPCVAKTHEFEATGLVNYNVTYKHLYEYMVNNRVSLPHETSGFDHFDAGLGSLYPMPGGLKECVEHYIGKTLRIDKSEGTSAVYKALDEYAKQPASKLPVLFDVLNCAEGCNAGTGCSHNVGAFDINATMDNVRQTVIDSEEGKRHLDELFEVFDENLRIEDFIRKYNPSPVKKIYAPREKIEETYRALGKNDETTRKFDCGACGNDSCQDLVERIAKGIDISKNCTEFVYMEMAREHENVINILGNFEAILKDTGQIKELTDGIVEKVRTINKAIATNAAMVKDIEKIATQVKLIAINASIEAARAGEHGKAFAVVAEEIRTLAQNSNDSAQKTKDVSSMANEAILSVNEMIEKIGENVNSFYTDITAISETTKKVLGKNEIGMTKEFSL
jgi:iron only hydrogenase large subunit-like protein